jgi:hypothetical protein
MPNTSRVNGFRPVRNLQGASWNGRISRYIVPASDNTAIFTGDAVKLSTTGDLEGYRTIAQAAAGDALIGVVVGFQPDYANLNAAPYRVASTRRIAFVVDDPQALFEAQEDGDTTPIAVASLGLNVNFIVAAGNTTTGQSGMQLDSSTAAVGATLPFKTIEVSQRSDNQLITAGQAFTRWIVTINNHQLGAGTGTAGV